MSRTIELSCVSDSFNRWVKSSRNREAILFFILRGMIMCKRLITLILVLALTGMASAAVNWTNAGADTDWLTAENWDIHVPYDSDSTFVKYSLTGEVGPTISESEELHVARNLSYEVGIGSNITSTMTGGTLNLYYAGASNTYLRLGAGDSSGTAIFNMSGGLLTVNVDENLYAKGTNGLVRVASGYAAEVNMSGDAEIIAWDMTIGGAGRVDLRDDAKITLVDDDSADVQSWIDDGKLTAYGTADLVYYEVVTDANSLNPNITTATVITAGFPSIATDPDPASNSDLWYDVTDEPILSWTAGAGVDVTHDVYFGTDADAVAAATTGSPEFIGNQASNSIERSVYHSAGPLALGQTYYWRIDEVQTGNPTQKGSVWNFTIYNYLVIDQFEDYDPNTLPTAWASAGGATVSLETVTPVRHTQSMMFSYDNTASPYESTAGFAVNSGQKDWTRLGVKAFGLWFYGDPANDITAPLYLTVEDNSANTSTIIYGTSADPTGEPYDNANVAVADWSEWRIDMQDFADDGVVLTDIKSLTIGFGDGVASTGTGTVWFDNIRMYEPLCFNGAGQAGGDLDGDCAVDIADLAIIAGNWLSVGWWPEI